MSEIKEEEMITAIKNRDYALMIVKKFIEYDRVPYYMMNFPMMTKFQYMEFKRYCMAESKNKTNLIKDTVWMFLEDRGYDDIEDRIRELFNREFYGLVDRYYGYLEYIAEFPELSLLGYHFHLNPKYYFESMGMMRMPSFSLKSLTEVVGYTARDITNMRVSESIYDRAMRVWNARQKAKNKSIYGVPHVSPLRGKLASSIYVDWGY